MQTQDKEKAKPETPEKPLKTASNPPIWPTGLVISKKENISVSIAEDLAVILTRDAFEQLFGWAYSTFVEISCLGTVRREGNCFFIERFYLLKQTGSSANTELDQAAISGLVERLIAEGSRAEAERIKCWVHSHPNMDTFWSTTDDATCRLLASDYLISIVVSNNFKIRCRIDIATPLPLVIDNVPVFYPMQLGQSQDKYAQEVKAAILETQFNQSHAAKEPDKKEDRFIPEQYCDYCGNWHGEGECPLQTREQRPVGFDEDNFMF